MRVVCTTQDSQEWFAARVGKVTASRMADAMGRLKVNTAKAKKGEYSQAHWSYVSELAWGLITRIPADHYVSRAMDMGKQFEKIARAEYAFRFGLEVDRTGFVLHPTLDFLGASPDGIVGHDGGLEIKVPIFKNHTKYLEADVVPEEYLPQMYCNMLCCERDWWDFVSFCPQHADMGDEAVALPDEFRIFRKRLFADAEVFKQMEEAATETMEQAVALVGELRKRYPAGDVPVSKLNAQLHESLTPYDPEKPFGDQDFDFLGPTLAECP